MIKAIFFDSGNVLVKEGFAPGIAEYEQRHNIPKGKLYASCHDRPFWKDFTLGNISEEAYFQKVVADFREIIDLDVLKKNISQGFIPNTPLLEYIRSLKPKYVLGIISNNPKEWFNRFWKDYGWSEIFSVKAVSGNLHMRKPAVEIYKYALNQAKVTGPESVYVDDRSDRISGAQEAGISIVIYNNLEQLKKDLNNL